MFSFVAAAAARDLLASESSAKTKKKRNKKKKKTDAATSPLQATQDTLDTACTTSAPTVTDSSCCQSPRAEISSVHASPVDDGFSSDPVVEDGLNDDELKLLEAMGWSNDVTVRHAGVPSIEFRSWLVCVHHVGSIAILCGPRDRS